MTSTDMTQRARNRRAMFTARLIAAATYRQRVADYGDWIKAVLGDLPAGVRDAGIEKTTALIRDLERLERDAAEVGDLLGGAA